MPKLLRALALCASLCLTVSGPVSSNDALFLDSAEVMQRAAIAVQQAKTVVRPAAATPVTAEIDPANQTGVLIGGKRFFIKDREVYEQDLPGGRVIPLTEGSDIVSIAAFQGALIALQATSPLNSGRIFLRYPAGADWIQIGFNTRKILATDRVLVALTHNRQLWLYQGRPGDRGFLGRGVAFYDIGLSDVADVAPVAVSGRWDVVVRFGNGKTALLGDIIPNP